VLGALRDPRELAHRRSVDSYALLTSPPVRIPTNEGAERLSKNPDHGHGRLPPRPGGAWIRYSVFREMSRTKIF